MGRYLIDVRVMPRERLLDPQGNAVHHALAALGFDEVAEVRIGKSLSLAVDAPDAASAAERANVMCERLLANPVTEDYVVVVEGEA
ncbi:MAG TPA: phosphoribosylformylglycinamidine synthase subunit PurS [Gemmatimonadales bacterium]